MFNYNNSLVIYAEQGLNGSYRCRVVNNFGSEFSNSATLKILGMYHVSTMMDNGSAVNKLAKI